MILTDRLLRNLQNTNIEPIMVMEIEGVPFLIGSDSIKRYPRYGDVGLEYGSPELKYGIPYAIDGQKTLISLEGTTTQIRQNLNPDKARATGVSQMTISLIDKNLEATKLASAVYGEILYKQVKVWISFGESAWKEDYIVIFRGIVESVEAAQGNVKLYLNSPQQKQRQLIAPKVETELVGNIDSSQTTIPLLSTDNLLQVPDHPLYSPKDTSLKTYIKIDDEIIQYESVSGLNLINCTRGQQGTIAASHLDTTSVESIYVLEGNVMELALKVMLSDVDQSYYIEDLDSSQTNWSGSDVISDTFFFADIDFTRDKNVQIGDYVVSSGFTDGANNLSVLTEILDVGVTDQGSYIVVDSTLSPEVTSTGKVSFLSKWNSLGGFGLKLNTDELDINQHIYLRNSFLTDLSVRFFIREEIDDIREWIEKELYLIGACYSLPSDREGLSRLSVGIHKPPIPGTNIVRLDRTNILKPDTISIKRGINKYYYNAIVFKYEDTILEDKLVNRVITVPGTLDVPTGTKALVIESKGLKDFYNAKLTAGQSGDRLLQRYKSAAESVDGMAIKFGAGVQVVAGDIVILDPDQLNMIDRDTATREKSPLLMEVVNRTVDIKTGSVKVDLVDTSFNINSRFGLISPCSLISNVITQTKFIITYNINQSVYGAAEYRKWEKLKRPGVTIRNYDFSDVHYTKILTVSSNTITIETAPSFTITSGNYFMEFSPYSNANTTDEQKLVYAYFTDGSNPFPDGGDPYVFI